MFTINNLNLSNKFTVLMDTNSDTYITLRRNMRFLDHSAEVWKTAGYDPKDIFLHDTRKSKKLLRRYTRLIRLLKKLGSNVRIMDGELLVGSDIPLKNNQGFPIDTYMLDKSGNLLIVGQR